MKYLLPVLLLGCSIIGCKKDPAPAAVNPADPVTQGPPGSGSGGITPLTTAPIGSAPIVGGENIGGGSGGGVGDAAKSKARELAAGASTPAGMGQAPPEEEGGQ